MVKRQITKHKRKPVQAAKTNTASQQQQKNVKRKKIPAISRHFDEKNISSSSNIMEIYYQRDNKYADCWDGTGNNSRTELQN